MFSPPKFETNLVEIEKLFLLSLKSGFLTTNEIIDFLHNDFFDKSTQLSLLGGKNSITNKFDPKKILEIVKEKIYTTPGNLILNLLQNYWFKSQSYPSKFFLIWAFLYFTSRQKYPELVNFSHVNLEKMENIVRKIQLIVLDLQDFASQSSTELAL